jgi:phosphoribosylanthranilate isomerase
VSGRLFVKICGITSVADAEAAAAAGADAIGLNCYPRSLRYVTPARAAEIVRALPPRRPLRVGVFVNAPPAEIAALDAALGLDVIQLHGDEDPEYVARVGPKAMKAIRVTGPESLAALRSYRCQAFLLDGPAGGAYGGAGRGFDWSLARAAKGVWRLVIAGGLTPHNVAEAVTAARPYGVDVASGVESEPGVKDPALMQAFVAAARAAAARAAGTTATGGE